MAGQPKEQGRIGASLVYTVDSFSNGIAFGSHRVPAGEDPRFYCRLHLLDEGDVVPLRSRYLLKRQHPLRELEQQLARVSAQGILREATIYFGVSTDPFHPFEGKFDASMEFLDLFSRYVPGRLIVQTRSPLIVLALPVFKRLGPRALVTIGLETFSQESACRYTPSLPRVKDRLDAAVSLRRLGIPVQVQVAPLLPYGDWRQDAGSFAELLHSCADHIFIRPLNDGSQGAEKMLRSSPVVRRLAAERKFHWLRADAAAPLLEAVQAIAPEKLQLPRPKEGPVQLEIFAA